MSERNQAACDLLKVAMNISAETMHDVFVSFSPHTKEISANIHIGGWRGSRKNSHYIWIKILGDDADTNLELARRDIVNIAAEGKVDPEGTYLKWT